MSVEMAFGDEYEFISSKALIPSEWDNIRKYLQERSDTFVFLANANDMECATPLLRFIFYLTADAEHYCPVAIAFLLSIQSTRLKRTNLSQIIDNLSKLFVVSTKQQLKAARADSKTNLFHLLTCE